MLDELLLVVAEQQKRDLDCQSDRNSKGLLRTPLVCRVCNWRPHLREQLHSPAADDVTAGAILHWPAHGEWNKTVTGSLAPSSRTIGVRTGGLLGLLLCPCSD